MASVTAFTAAREQAIEDGTVVSGSVDGSGHLILQRHDGSTVDAGNVKGPAGPTGPPGSSINAWPVGSIFMAVVPTNPATLLGGGTWTAWGTGRVAIAVDPAQTEFDTVEETGGSKTHQHTLSDGGYADILLGTSTGIIRERQVTGSWTQTHSMATSGAATASSGAIATATALGGHTDNGSTLPPYITCYMWKRTA